MANTPPMDIPIRSSSLEDWLNWYKSLRFHYGRRTAKELFELAWAKRSPNDLSKISDLHKWKELSEYIWYDIRLEIDINAITSTKDKLINFFARYKIFRKIFNQHIYASVWPTDRIPQLYWVLYSKASDDSNKKIRKYVLNANEMMQTISIGRHISFLCDDCLSKLHHPSNFIYCEDTTHGNIACYKCRKCYKDHYINLDHEKGLLFCHKNGSLNTST